MEERDRQVLTLIETARGQPRGPDREAAFTRLYELFQKPLLRFLTKVTATFIPRPREGDLDEIVQGAMTSALTRIAGYDAGRATFFTWLATIGRNEALAWLDERRRQRSRQAFSQDDAEAPVVPYPQDVAIEALAFHRELFGGMARAVLRIRNPLHRLVMGLVYLGWSDGLDDMARVLGENYNSLKSAYRRGLADLIGILEEEQDALFVEMARRSCEINKDAHAARGLSAADPDLIDALAAGPARTLASQALLGGIPLAEAARVLGLAQAPARAALEEAVLGLVAAAAAKLSGGKG